MKLTTWNTYPRYSCLYQAYILFVCSSYANAFIVDDTSVRNLPLITAVNIYWYSYHYNFFIIAQPQDPSNCPSEYFDISHINKKYQLLEVRASWVLWLQVSEATLPIYHTYNVPSFHGKILEEPDVTHASQALYSSYNMTKVFFRWQCQSHFLYPSFTDINFDSGHTYTTVLANDDHRISQNEASNACWWSKCVISHAAFSKSLDDNNNNIHGVTAEPNTEIIEDYKED